MTEWTGGRGPGRKIALAIGGLVGAVVLALVAVVLLLQTGAASRRVKDLVVPRVSAALGREVTVQDARLRVLPNPRVVLAGTTIAGRPGEPPLAQLRSLDVELALWPLVTSLGQEIRVEGIALVRPEVNLVRGRDGVWNHEGLGGSSPAGAEPAPPATGSEQGGGAKLYVARARIEDGALRIVDRSGGREDAAVALTKIDLQAEGGLGERVAAKLSAALAGDAKNLELELESPRLPERIGPGSYPELTGRLALRDLALARIRGLLPANVTAMFTGGRVSAEAKVSSEPGAKAYLLDGSGKLADVKLQGQPASGGFELHARADPAAGAARVEVRNLVVKGPGVDLGGAATLDTKPVRATFAVKGPLLDLGTVLGLVPKDPSAPPPAPEEATKGALVPPAMAKELAAVAVTGTLDIAEVRNGKLVARDLQARGALRNGIFALERATAGLYGGKVDASGTQVHLTDPSPRWHLETRLEGVDLAQAFGAIAGAAPLAGKLSGTLDLAGVGSNWDQLQKVLTGNGAISLKEGALTTADLGGEALGAVAKGLEQLGRGGAAKKVAGLEGGKTTLRDLAGSFTVKDGFMTLSRPLEFTTPVGRARLGGRIGLSQQLALEGGLAVTKEALARAGLPAIGAGPIELPLKLGGTLGAPSVQLDAAGALSGAAKGLVAGKKEEVQQEVQRQGRRRAEDALRGLFK
jgi:AsmA protein